MIYMVTEKQLELLACLEKNSRLSVNTLAKLLNIEVEEVKKMVTKLESEKIIVDYVTQYRLDKSERTYYFNGDD